ncbi:MAG: sn-glycerol-3-phosphate ABC transporter ATP-binding protein UgpC [Gemmatimonadota bacterium]|nr:MAG: sn-glycerol-3-phosphate ABC transporter ATP-binding protein UgpC [Gemmatimonadota bacterium]
MAQVVFKNVNKIYDKNVAAVKDANLEIRDKELVVLVGPSGCGKSTLLRLIAGLEEVTSGEIYIDGRVVNTVPPKDRDIAMVFQNYALYPHMTVFDNMAFGLKMRKFSKSETKKRVNDAATILDVAHLLDRKPKALSGGQRQRVALGRTLVRKPKVFLFDEPLSNLDAKLRTQMRAEISKLHARLGATMIYVTHDQVEAMSMGQRIVVLKDGRIQQVDEPLHLYEKPANKFVAGFIGSPAMNFFEGQIQREDGLLFRNGELHLSLAPNMESALGPYVGKNVVFGMRPEHISYGGERSARTDGSTVTATLDVLEPLGSEVYLYLSVGDHPFIARTEMKAMPKAGDALEVVFDMNRAHFFERESEQAIV